MQHFDTEQFIGAVEKRQALWNMSCEDYKNKLLVKRLWHEVSAVMCPSFDDLSSDKQEEITRELQRKWRNIRDAFVRYLRNVQKSTFGPVRKPGKPYRYARSLEFLSTHMSQSSETTTFDPISIKVESENYEELDGDENSLPDMTETENSIEESLLKAADVEKVDVCISPFQLQEFPSTEVSSDDMDFFRSMLPMLRTMPMQQKLKFRMDVMKSLLEHLKS